MPLGQEQEFLPTLAKPPAEHAPAPERKERLDDLVSRSLRIVPGVQERRDPIQTVRLVRDRNIHEGQAGENYPSEMGEGRPPGEEHAEHHRRHGHDRAKVRLEQGHTQEHPGHGKDRRQAALEILDELLLGAEIGAHIHDQSELHELGGLEGKAPRPDPPARPIDGPADARNERGGQQNERYDQQQEHDPLVRQQPVVHAHGRHHEQEADDRPQDLAPHEVGTVAIGREGDRAAGAVHHHHADGKKQHHRHEQDPVVLSLCFHHRHILDFNPEPWTLDPVLTVFSPLP
jgi:hypothetical protein